MGDVSLLSECGWHEDEAEPGEYRCHYMRGWEREGERERER